MLVSLEAIETELSKRSFKHFTKAMWPLVDKAEFIPNWHIDAICDHLQAVHEGKTRDLIINIPFRLGKSLIVSVLYPAWVWLTDPTHKFVCTSHTHKTVTENAMKMRSLVQKPEYQRLAPSGFKLEKDTENYFSNNFGGHRQSYSVETSVTGITANTLIIDDPMTTATATSNTERERIERTLSNDFMTRLTPPGKARRIVVMQRLHQRDTAGKYLDNESFDRLIIPAVWDGVHRSRTCLNWVDPRTELGTSIFPAYMTDEFLANIRIENGPQFFASQLMQEPVADSGSIIKHEWIKTYRELPSDATRITISCDTAIKIEQHNDYSVLIVWARNNSGFYILDLIRKKLEFPELKQMLQQMCTKYRPNEVLIEDKASGQQLIQEFRRLTSLPVIGINPKGTKGERLNLCTGQFEAGRVYIPERAPWAFDFTNELCSFPYAEHDDIVDAVTQYLQRVSSMSNPNIRVL